MFDHFVVYVDGIDDRIEPKVRNEAWTSVAHETESGDLIPVPVLRPARLELPGERNANVGLPTHYFFDAIPVGSND
jgi:hypothetical protein